MATEVPLTQGHVAQIDDEDATLVLSRKWRLCRDHRNLYAATHIRMGDRYVSVSLHRFLLDRPEGKQVDHINGDGLDCRRSNLRIASAAENARNRRPHAGSSVPYKGIGRQNRRWFAAITFEGVRLHIGSYATPEEAARAYDAKAKELFGEFARLNFSDESADGEADRSYAAFDRAMRARTVPIRSANLPNAVAIVDAEDFDRVSAFRWNARRGRRTWYAQRQVRITGGKCRGIQLHRFILDAPTGKLVDHINGNGLDCRKANMRLADAGQNSRNRRSNEGSISRFKGVSVIRRDDGRIRAWTAAITFERRQKWIGVFGTEDEAAVAYDKQARELFGEFARTNFPEDPQGGPDGDEARRWSEFDEVMRAQGLHEPLTILDSDDDVPLGPPTAADYAHDIHPHAVDYVPY